MEFKQKQKTRKCVEISVESALERIKTWVNVSEGISMKVCTCTQRKESEQNFL